jgi:hypothetical protein
LPAKPRFEGRLPRRSGAFAVRKEQGVRGPQVVGGGKVGEDGPGAFDVGGTLHLGDKPVGILPPGRAVPAAQRLKVGELASGP